LVAALLLAFGYVSITKSNLQAAGMEMEEEITNMEAPMMNMEEPANMEEGWDDVNAEAPVEDSGY
jgi:hypothetical protein